MRPPIKIIVASQIVLTKAQLPPKVRRFVREQLFIPNSEYIIKQRLGKPVYDVPKFFDLIEERGRDMLLPRGFLGQLTAFLDEEKFVYEVAYHHAQPAPRMFHSTITLRDDQVGVVDEAYAKTSGVIVAPPGSGKTIMGLELVARHQKPALILTHR